MKETFGLADTLDRLVQVCLYVFCTGKGAIRLADSVLRAVEEPVEFKFLYDLKVSGIALFKCLLATLTLGG